MKLISAVIAPSDLAVARRALAAFGAPGLTVVQLSAATLWKRRLQIYRAQVLVADLVPRLRIEVLAPDEDAGELAELLAHVAGRSAGRSGDDTLAVWIQPVDDAVRVRTGERGGGAL